jgi:S-adenosylmethionine/arginine decarboxylase-like enzyme
MLPKMPHVTWEFTLENEEGKKKLSNPNTINTFARQFCEKFELTLLPTNLVYQFKGNKPDENGITAFYILSESGIHIQTWPEHRYGFIDVFSCKHFDYKVATKFIMKFFGKGNYYYDIVWRGEIIDRERKEKKKCYMNNKDILLDTKLMKLRLREKENKESLKKYAMKFNKV